MIGDIAHGIDRFPGRAGVDQDVAAGKQAALETFGGPRRDVGRFQHATGANVAAGLTTVTGTKHLYVALQQQRQVVLGCRVAPHCLIHRRGNGNRRIGSQDQCGQQIVTTALGQAGHHVGGCRSNKHQVGPARQFNVAHRGLGGGVQQVAVYGVPGQRLQGQRGNELAGRVGHDNTYLGAGVAQASDQLCTFIGSYATTDTKHHLLVK